MPGRGGVSLQQRTLMDFNTTDYCSAKKNLDLLLLGDLSE